MHISFNYFRLYIHVFVKRGRSHGGSIEEVKENIKVLYHFANFAIVNKLLIIKNRRISSAYWLMQARDEMRPPCQRGCLARGKLFITSGNATHERRITLDLRSELYDSFSPSLYHKIKFSNGTENVLCVCVFVCV